MEIVSVIIPTYNRADLIRETIDSVLSQTYPEFEILICDDGSTDNTQEIINSYNDSRIKYLYQKNSGLPAKARNLGLQVAKGSYIAFVDSDDIWLPTKLAKQIQILQKKPQIMAVASNAIVFPLKEHKAFKFKQDKLISFDELLLENIIFNSSVLIKRQILDEIGFLDENPQLRVVEEL